jgi:hypothetical protein
MFNVVIGVLAGRGAKVGNQVIITPTINNLVMVTTPLPPINVSNANNDIVAVSTFVPPINVSNADGDIVAVTQFIPPIHISDQTGT